MSKINSKPVPAVDVDSDDDDDLLLFDEDSGEDTLNIRITSWNFEGAEDTPGPKDLMAVAFASESKFVHVYALQEVKCLEKLREALLICLGGPSKFELFEHWMGRAGAGFAGQTVLLVFAPKDLCVTGRFRLSRFANSQVKREVLRGTRFKLLGGTTSSRGAVAMPFTFLDTTFSLVSVRLVEEETEKHADQQQRDLEKIMDLCRMSDNAETSTVGSLHHAFLCGSFAMGTPSSKQSSSDAGSNNNASSSSLPRKSISARFSFVRRPVKSTTASQLMVNDALLQPKQKFRDLDSFEEMDELAMSLEPDHIFYKSASEKLESCLKPISSTLLTNVRCGRPPVSAVFQVQGKGSHILSSWSRLTGNVPIHLSSRSNYVHARNEQAQRPRISTAPMLRMERERSGTSELLRKMTLVHEKYVLECTRCEAPISDSEMIVPVTKDGCAYHARCFCCDHCGVPLCSDAPTSLAPGQAESEVVFHEVEGKILCQKSFETLYINCCEACGGSLGDEFLVLPGHGESDGDVRRFHISCFKCGVCMRPFATKVMMGDIVIEAAIPHDGMYLCEADFARSVGGVKCCVCDHSFSKGIKIGGDIYCQADFNETFSGGKCAICEKPVTDEQALTLSSRDPGQKRACHMQCLKCSVCQRKIHELNQSFVEFDKQIYCQEDWDKKQASLVYPNCAKCRQPVKEDRVDALDTTFHPKCFGCTFCGTSLVGIKFYVSDGKIWCLNDFERFCCSDLPACASCHRTVGSADKAKAQQIDSLTWHADCFVCCRCGVALKGKKTHVLKGKVFCEKC